MFRVLATASVMLFAACSFEGASPSFSQDTTTGKDQRAEDGVTKPDGVGPDTIGPDTSHPKDTQPDLPTPTCVEAGGVCQWPTEGPGNGCQPGWGPAELEGCQAGEICCVQGRTCIGEGDFFQMDNPDGICCEGLVPLQDCWPQARPVGDGGEKCACSEESVYVCTKCGDKVCGEGENSCNCEEDCPWIGPNKCLENGGYCAPFCDEGAVEKAWAGCPGAEVCCLKQECLGEGAQHAMTPGAPPCCPGLEQIPASAWDPESGQCDVLDGSFVCSKCGNLECEEWESPCSCEKDCVDVPENLCELQGGICVADDCPEGWSAVWTPGCGLGMTCCKQNEDECYKEGETFQGDPDQCCPGLVVVADAFPGDDGGCVSPACECWVCTLCGDNNCGQGENVCNCEEDCNSTTPPDDDCNANGGFCKYFDPDDPNSMGCPENYDMVDFLNCPDNQYCCAPAE